MSTPESPARRRPVPPPKTESQAQLRQDLLSPARSQRDASHRHQEDNQPPADLSDAELSDADAQLRETVKHLTLPPGWDLQNKADVTYHTHLAKPVVHETRHEQIIEYVKPVITRHIHHYHQYDYIQPLEVQVPNDCYALNGKGEVIHLPDSLTTQPAQSSHREQERQDRGYGLGPIRTETTHPEQVIPEPGRDSTAGPFPIEAEGGGERILHEIRDGGIARRFGGPLTSKATPPSQPPPTAPPRHSQPSPWPRGGGVEETASHQQSAGIHASQTSQQHSDHSSRVDHPPPNPNVSPQTKTPSLTTTKPLIISPSQQNYPEAKPLPSLPQTSPRSPKSKSSVTRASADQKLRDRSSTDSTRPTQHGHNPITDDDAVPERSSSVKKMRIY